MQYCQMEQRKLIEISKRVIQYLQDKRITETLRLKVATLWYDRNMNVDIPLH